MLGYITIKIFLERRGIFISKLVTHKFWRTDFTYLNLTNGSKGYNCTIIDLYDRFTIATFNGKK